MRARTHTHTHTHAAPLLPLQECGRALFDLGADNMEVGAWGVAGTDSAARAQTLLN
jgi:hypothetical protein